MEVPLTPLEFARRARKLYPEREAVVDGTLRLTYSQFFNRCDQWSSALQKLGIREGDRVAYIAPNTHAQLESFYAVPRYHQRRREHFIGRSRRSLAAASGCAGSRRRRPSS